MDDVQRLLRVKQVGLKNYRGFQSVNVALDPNVTVLFGENGSGKSNLLGGIATLLAGLFASPPLALHADDAHEQSVPDSLLRQGTYPVSLRAEVDLCGEAVTMERQLREPGGNTTSIGLRAARERFVRLQGSTPSDRVRPGNRTGRTGPRGRPHGADFKPWPLLAWYGAERLHQAANATQRKRPEPGRRTDGWVDCLDPRSSEEQLLQWWFEVSLLKLQGQRSLAHEALTRLLGAILCSDGAQATDDPVISAEMELPEALPVLRFQSGHTIRWTQLSDGHHTLLGMVGDLARRAWLLNDGVLSDPIAMAEGVVLIDEVDLHLHPRLQMSVLGGLRRAFPRVQFVVTTHSPFVLASVRNDQVRRLEAGRLVADRAVVHGRDPNSVVTTAQGAALRPKWARDRLQEIVACIDDERLDEAREQLNVLAAEWGSEDAEVAQLYGWLAGHSAADNEGTDDATR